jgi:hypothetical protein
MSQLPSKALALAGLTVKVPTTPAGFLLAVVSLAALRTLALWITRDSVTEEFEYTEEFEGPGGTKRTVRVKSTSRRNTTDAQVVRELSNGEAGFSPELVVAEESPRAIAR